MFKRLYEFLRKNNQLAYSLLLIILIPVIIAGNTLWQLRSIDRDINFLLRKEALLAGSVIGAMAYDGLQDKAMISAKLAKIVHDEPSITAITILTPDSATHFSTLATTSQAAPIATDQDLGSLVWTSNQSFAAVVNDQLTHKKVWSVILPITNADGNKIALADVRVATTEVDAIITRSIEDSLLILAGSIVVVLLLLVNHFRFFEYARLFTKLKEVDEMKDNFISMASHELRTPLTAISGFSYLLQHDSAISASKDAEHEAVMITEATRRLADLVEDLLNVSRIEQNRLQFQLVPLAIDQTIRSIIDELITTAQAKQLTISFTPVSPQPNVLVDEAKLKQVLVNLIGNAIKYTQKGDITINQKVEGGMLRTFIKDTGIGMSPEAREHLFEKFYRIQTEATKDIPGTGLGLWITKQLVTRMRGKIFVDSIEGAGTQFTIAFPLAT